MDTLTIYLVNTLLKVTALLAAAGLATALARRASAATRHLIWTGALGAAVLLAILIPVIPAWRVMPAWGGLPVEVEVAPAAAARPSPSSSPVSASISASPAASASSTSSAPSQLAAKGVSPSSAQGNALTRNQSPASRQALAVSATTSASGHAMPAQATSAGATSARTTSAQAASANATSARASATPTIATWSFSTFAAPATLWPGLLALWLAGSMVLLARYAMQSARLHRALGKTRLAEGGPQRRLRHLSAHIGIRRPVALRESQEIEVPMTWGVIHPNILLPQAATEWSAERLDAVLQHELAHVKRLDALTQWLAHLACALYWFHPLVWHAAKQMRAERERACDDLVIHSGIQPSTYANDLLEIVSSFRTAGDQYPAGLAMARRSQFEGRLMALLNPHTKRSSISSTQVLFAIVVMAAIALPLAALAPRHPMGGPEDPAGRGVAAQAKGKYVSADAQIAESDPTERAQIAMKIAALDRSLAAVTGKLADLQGKKEDLSGARAELTAELGSLQASRAELAAKLGDLQASRAELGGNLGTLSAARAELAMVPANAQTVQTFSSAGSGQTVVSVSGSEPVRAVSSGSGFAYSTGDSGTTAVIAPGGQGFKGDVVVNTETDSKPVRVNFLSQAARAAVGEDLLTGCITGKSSNSSSMTHDDGATRRVNISWKGRDCSLDMRAEGKYTFNQDFSGFQSISDGGFVSVTADIRDEITKLSIRPGSDGKLEYKFSRNGQEQPFLPAGSIFLGKFMITLDRVSASAVDVRLPQMLRAGGVDRVLAEIEAMYADYARATYLRKLVETATLNPTELQHTLEMDKTLSSDYEKARVLIAVAKKYDLKEVGVRDAFLAVTRTLSSDYEHARTLLAFFEKGSATPDQVHAILTSVPKMSSDYERGRVLMKLAEVHKLDANDRALFVSAAAAMSSDYERGRTLKTVISTQANDDQTAMAVIQATNRMSSDYEKGQVLRALAAARSIEGALKEAYVHAAQSMSSDYERNRALSAIVVGETKRGATL